MDHGPKWPLRGLVAAALALVTLLAFSDGARAQGTYEILHAYTRGGIYPSGPLIQAGNGNFYGTTQSGGVTNGGTVFTITGAGIVTTLHSFDCPTIEGCAPMAGLIQASDGNFYGTTQTGGAAGRGTVFTVTPAGTFVTLHSFRCSSSEGCIPFAGLVQARDGTFYGTTESGGAADGGTIFTITSAGIFTTLHSFNCLTDGCSPRGSLIQARDGDFYGVIQRGGPNGKGTIFRVTPAGALTTLHSFDCRTGGCSPAAGLIEARDGTFYGTTAYGGVADVGTVFTITAAAVFTTLHSFDCRTDGCFPDASLIQARNGNVYGTTRSGGDDGAGTLFRIAPAHVFTTLHSFDCSTDGCSDRVALVQATDGNFYGTTGYGGVAGAGTVFKATPAGAVTVLHSFGCGTEGCNPAEGLVQATDGNFYGTTGGAVDSGTVFKITPSGALTTLRSVYCGDSENCLHGLIQASDGHFYGTTESGGGTYEGTVFKITPAGALTTLHAFDCSTEGCVPTAGLIQATDDNFYGTARFGGAADGGTVFKMTPTGALTMLHAFDCSIEGCSPRASLVQAADGNFYGTTERGGAAGQGTVFKMTPAGALTTLHSFECGTDGCSPRASLVQAADGNFYGTTERGGAADGGTVFTITPAGALTTLHSFDCRTEGCRSSASLIQAGDDNFYGTTQRGGLADGGTVFTMTPAGAVATLHSFICRTDGCSPRANLVLGGDGRIYGAATVDGPGGAGVLFRLTIGPVSILSPANLWIGLKSSDDVGLKVDLLAEAFVGTTKIGEDQLPNVSTGSSGFNNARLDTILLKHVGPAPVPIGAALKIKVSVRRTCAAGTPGHASGTVRLWYGGRRMDTGASRDAGSRFDVTIGDANASYFLRTGFALNKTAGNSKQSIDVAVDSKEPCATRTFKPFGTWSIVP